ncbi:GntR family transcriptional regulator [Sphingopyxis sp. DBS4]|uniref:GntR family transcriptional regulator n=1 Tax=Sphingopyxis sp. DBS4 TaxID=2968500 RepID=UPI00214B381C|nr:GntR family transcriptional regulator [Sphingopyxis sp. DBS4]
MKSSARREANSRRSGGNLVDHSLTRKPTLAPATAQTTEDSKSTEKPSSPDMVVNAIYRGILAGRFVPGQKLIEADLAASLNVSRGPIREALKRLHAEGVVENARNRGAYVRLLSRREAIDFIEILSELTGFIAQKAAEAVSRGDDMFRRRFAPALETLGDFLKSEDSDKLQLETNRRFYDAMMEVGGNSQIASVMPMMRIQLFRMQGQMTIGPEAHKQRFTEFADIARHVLAGEPDKARQAMSRHMQLTLKRLEELPDEVFARA